jgi:hypothetical protein
MRFSTKQRLTVAAFACIVVAAAVRGNALLGGAVAVAFGVLASAPLFLVWRAFSTPRKFPTISQAIAVVLTAAVLAFVAFPASFNHDFARFIEDHQIERLTGTQLKCVVGSSPRFAGIVSSCTFRKCILVTIRGTIATQSDLLDLRTKILDACPHVASRWLYWELTVEESGRAYRDCDLTLFGDSPAPGQVGENRRESSVCTSLAS